MAFQPQSEIKHRVNNEVTMENKSLGYAIHPPPVLDSLIFNNPAREGRGSFPITGGITIASLQWQ
jgi:hypothetical protein